MPFWGFLLIGTLLMIAVLMIARLPYQVPAWKTILIAIILTGAGYAGAKLMAFIESGNWSGRSFFGAVFFAPFVMIPAALLLKLRPATVMDMSAGAECAMLALLKIKCNIDGCCYGTVMRISSSGQIVRFPSQIVECVAAIILMLILLLMSQKEKLHGRIYPWYMVLYGVTRFALNLLRDTTPFVWILPAGNFWALISILFGLLMLAAIEKC